MTVHGSRSRTKISGAEEGELACADARVSSPLTFPGPSTRSRPARPSARLELCIGNPEDLRKSLSLGGREIAVGTDVQFDCFDGRQRACRRTAVVSHPPRLRQIEPDTEPVGDAKQRLAAGQAVTALNS